MQHIAYLMNINEQNELINEFLRQFEKSKKRNDKYWI